MMMNSASQYRARLSRPRKLKNVRRFMLRTPHVAHAGQTPAARRIA
jgi:hypothetical protein